MDRLLARVLRPFGRVEPEESMGAVILGFSAFRRDASRFSWQFDWREVAMFAILGIAGRYALPVPLAETLLAGWVLSRAGIERWNRFRDGRCQHPYKLWSLVLLEIWYRLFITGSLTPRLLPLPAPVQRDTAKAMRGPREVVPS